MVLSVHMDASYLSKPSAYTYQQKFKPRAAKDNAAIAIVSEESADYNIDESTPTLSNVDQQNLVSIYYVHLGVPPNQEWNGEGGRVSKIVSVLSYIKNQRRRVKEVIANYLFTTFVVGNYNPQRKSCTNATAIEDKGHIQQMVCNYIESGVSLTETQLLVNIWCIKHGELTVTCYLIPNQVLHPSQIKLSRIHTK
jgi:hypothetical protein